MFGFAAVDVFMLLLMIDDIFDDVVVPAGLNLLLVWVALPLD